LLDRFHDCASMVSQTSVSLDNVHRQQSEEDHRVHRGSQLVTHLASRGVPLQELMDNPLWWHGPTWLQRPRDHWLRQGTDLPVTEIEKRAVKAHVASLPSLLEQRGLTRVCGRVRSSA